MLNIRCSVMVIYHLNVVHNAEGLKLKKVKEMVKVTILNETGHTELMMSAEGAFEQIIEHPTHWAYIDGELVSREELGNVNFNDVNEVVLTQAIVGGDDSYDE